MSGFDTSRRRFLQIAAATVTTATALTPQGNAPSVIDMPFSAANPRIGIIGVGGRRTVLLKNLLAADVQVKALCDTVRDKA